MALRHRRGYKPSESLADSIAIDTSSDFFDSEDDDDDDINNDNDFGSSSDFDHSTSLDLEPSPPSPFPSVSSSSSSSPVPSYGSASSSSSLPVAHIPGQPNPTCARSLWDVVRETLQQFWAIFLPSSWNSSSLSASGGVAKATVLDLDEDTKKFLDEYKSQTTKAYDASDPEHEKALQLYWSLCCPSEALESRKSNQWKQLGFQYSDPASDFRGVGVFGLKALLYFALAYPDTFHKMLSAQRRSPSQESYPFSIAGLNIVCLLFEFLGWGFKPSVHSASSRSHAISMISSSSVDDPCIFSIPYSSSSSSSSSSKAIPVKKAEEVNLLEFPEEITWPPVSPPQASPSPITDEDFFKALDFSPPPPVPSTPAPFLEEPQNESLFDQPKKDEIEEDQKFEVAAVDQAFFEIFCLAFRLLEDEWYNRPNVHYMNFPDVMQATSRRFETLLDSIDDLNSIKAMNQYDSLHPPRF